ncbi:hypothetical protein KRR26_05980 [Corallococcus sp. M34]|uniref:hypothetical protein n=1 Tax=Citreicoccus inhibens TaxID=2849499 RepID=UPI001C2207FF|nr:hypothetical protein [Citreicoccus inhibens]MBU8895143.1 hypothetical protein [Citreicoccus inhibens]
MSGRSINIDYSPVDCDMVDLWTRVVECLCASFGLDDPQSCLAGLEYLEHDDDWATGEAFDESQFSLEDFVRLNLGLVLDCSLWSHSLELHSRVSLYRYPPSFRGTPCLSVSFGTLLDRNLYPDVAQANAEADPKQSLIHLCLSLASATRASAFIVYNDNEGPLVPVEPREFAQRLLSWPERNRAARSADEIKMPSRDDVGMYNGISRELLSRQALVSAWGEEARIRETTSGYVTLDLL